MRMTGKESVWWDCGKVEIKQLLSTVYSQWYKRLTRSIEDLETEIVELLNLIES